MRIVLFGIIALSLLIISCKSDSSSDPALQSIEEAYFDDYDAPSEKWGYMNTNGETVIKPKYDDVRDMLGNITAANYKGRWGFINSKGEKVIDFQYKQVQDFDPKGERAFVQNFENKWFLIDAKNAIIDSMPYDNFKQFVGDFCPVAKDGSWGVIDKNAKLIIPNIYTLIEVIGDNNIIAKKYGKQGIINSKNEPLLDFKFKKINDCGNGMLRVRDDNGYSFYDIKAYKKISPNYIKASLMQDGYFVGKTEKGQAIYDSQFKIFKALSYERVEYANQNRWVFKQDGLWGILDEYGEVLASPKYELINKYEEDIILFSINEMWGYLDLDGEIFIPAELPIAWEYKNGYARILHQRGIGFIDKSKTLVVNRRVFEVRDFYNGLARFQAM